MITINNLTELGIYLQTQREKQGMSVDALADALKIRMSLVHAIESGDFSHMPGHSSYAIGFLKTYARVLGLDGEEVAACYRQCEGTGQTVEFHFPEEINDASRPSPLLIAVGLVIALLSYVAWHYVYYGDVASDGGYVALPSEDTVAAFPVVGMHEEEARLVVLAQDHTWIKVTDNEQTLLYEATLQSGDTFFLPSRKDLIITASNAESIELFLDNSQGGSAGVIEDVVEK